MENKLINDRLQQYNLITLEDEENALKEILQEVALYALASTHFFSKALFQGGTALRILYQLPRFSEDLDFILKEVDLNFKWDIYIAQIAEAMKIFGVEPEIIDRSKADNTIQKLFIKDNSIGKILNLKFNHYSKKELMIKLEIDTNPPSGSNEEIKFLDFPLDCSITAQDLPSSFAGKCHALLCREYVKGRDWFDFGWYVNNKTNINFDFLTAAIDQNGPWQGQGINVSKDWLIEQLQHKIKVIDWDKAKLEVKRFLSPTYQKNLDLWSESLFLDKTKKLALYL